MHKIYENNDLAMYFKKRYCHCCGKKLQRKKQKELSVRMIPNIELIVVLEPTLNHMGIYWLLVKIIIVIHVINCFRVMNKMLLFGHKNIISEAL